MTTLLVTHDQEEALSIADQVAVMRDGRFTKVGTPQEVYLQPERPVHRRVPRRLRAAAVHGRVPGSPTARSAASRAHVRGRRARHADAAPRATGRDRRSPTANGSTGIGTVLASEFRGHDVLLTVDPAATPHRSPSASTASTHPPVDAQGPHRRHRAAVVVVAP